MKAILVINMPKSCAVCPIFQEGIDGYCPIGFLTPSNKYEIAKGCPLKPMPKKRTIDECEQVYIQRQLEKVYNDGWNTCLEELDD